MVGVARFLFLAAGRGLGPCSGCPSCPLLRSPSGRGFFVFSLTEGAGFVASRVAWISGSEPPPAVATPVTRVWQVKIPCLSTVKPCGGFALHLYTAAKGFGPFYSVTMVGDLSVTRCGFQRSRCVGFWGHGASPYARGIGFFLSLCVFIIAPEWYFVKTFFLFFLDFFCLVLPSRFQRLAVAFLALGSHLYPAQQDSVRQGSLGWSLPHAVSRSY